MLVNHNNICHGQSTPIVVANCDPAHSLWRRRLLGLRRQREFGKSDMLPDVVNLSAAAAAAEQKIVNAKIATVGPIVIELSLKAKRLQAPLERMYAGDSGPV